MSVRPALLIALCLLACAAHAQTVHDPAYVLSTELSDLLNPQAIARDAGGNLYVTDSGRGRILKGQGGIYVPFVSNIPVAPFNGLDLGPLAIAIAPAGDILYGEAGRPTGVEQVHQHAASGALIRSLAPVAGGGNWAGIAIDPASGRLFAASANGDRIFAYAADPSSSPGSWANPTTFTNTADDGLLAPTALVVAGNTLYAGMYGPFGGNGRVGVYDLRNGQLSTSFALPSAVTGLALLANGRLAASTFGLGAGDGQLLILDPATGAHSALVSGLNFVTGVASAGDGTLFVTEMGTFNGGDGRILKLTPIPEPAVAVVLLASCFLIPRRASRTWYDAAHDPSRRC